MNKLSVMKRDDDFHKKMNEMFGDSWPIRKQKDGRKKPE